MDFKLLVTEPMDLRSATADALLVVVGEGTAPESLGKALGAALSDADWAPAAAASTRTSPHAHTARAATKR